MVDIGEVREIRLQCACHLPDKCDILQVPYQAFRVFVADVKPFDNDLEWTRQASLAVANSIGGKEMNGRIVLTLGDTMWLVNLHEQKQLKFTVQSETVSMFLIWNKLAVKNQRVSGRSLHFCFCNPCTVIIAEVKYCYSENMSVCDALMTKS